METLTRSPKYEWYNKLSCSDRLLVVSYYLEGYGLYHIANSFGVTASTVEYHLKKANVFIPNKKPTLYAKQNPIKKPQPIIKRTLTVFIPVDNDKYYFDDFGDRYLRPKSYAQLVRQANRIQAEKKRFEIQQQEVERPRGILIKMNLSSGASIRKIDGHYEITVGNSGPTFQVSDSIYSL